MIPSNQLFHCPTAVNKTIVAIEGIESGIYILNKMVNCPALSNKAASSISRGMPLKKFISISTNQTSHAPGKT